MTEYTKPIVFVFAIFVAVAVIVFSIIRKRNRLRVGLDVAFIAYCACVIAILYFPLTINSDEPFTMSSIIIKWIPFKGVYEYFVRDNSLRGLKEVVYSVMGNLLLFTPLSAYLTWTRFEKYKQNLWITVCISGVAEILQLIIIVLAKVQTRTIDSTDVILNCCGAFISLLIFHKILTPISKSSKK